MSILEDVKLAKKSSIHLANLALKKKNEVLHQIALEIDNRRDEIKNANEKDYKRSLENNLSKPLLKRLVMDDYKIDGVIEGIHSLINLPDPVDDTTLARELDKHLDLYRVTVPIGVIGVIFESRPDAFVQISTLCLKSGNACILKGGSEAQLTNEVLYDIILSATKKTGIDENWIKNIGTREEVAQMLKLDKYIDLIIPRGSNSFVQYIMQNANIPVMGHADGICHVFVDEQVDIDMAVDIVIDSKTQYVSVCNALETLLVHKDTDPEFLEKLWQMLLLKKVTVNGCERTAKIIECEKLTEEKLRTEFLDYEMNIKIVDSLDEAIDHINEYGSSHTDVIVTENAENSIKFMNYVDSANVFYNCSSRFSDGFRYGFGAEVGVSTNKIHARGPVGLEGLVIYKYKLIGHGQVVEDYMKGNKKFTHKELNRVFEAKN